MESLDLKTFPLSSSNCLGMLPPRCFRMPFSHPALRSDTSPAELCHLSPGWSSQNQTVCSTSLLWAKPSSQRRIHNFTHALLWPRLMMGIHLRHMSRSMFSFFVSDIWRKVDVFGLRLLNWKGCIVSRFVSGGTPPISEVPYRSIKI